MLARSGSGYRQALRARNCAKVGQSGLGGGRLTYFAVAHDLVELISPNISLTGILALAPNVLILQRKGH